MSSQEKLETPSKLNMGKTEGKLKTPLEKENQSKIMEEDISDPNSIIDGSYKENG
jgi:hypothetical protein